MGATLHKNLFKIVEETLPSPSFSIMNKQPGLEGKISKVKEKKKPATEKKQS